MVGPKVAIFFHNVNNPKEPTPPYRPNKELWAKYGGWGDYLPERKKLSQSFSSFISFIR